MAELLGRLRLWRDAGAHCWRALVLCTLGVGIVALLATAPVHANEAEYRLGTGDELGVTVFGHPDLSGKFHVGSNGTIAMPLIGEVRVAQMTLRQAEQQIVSRLKPDYLRNPQVSIDVLNYRPFYIIGEVRNPGSYPYVGGMTVVNAVAMAGGFTYRARESRIQIQRAGSPDGKMESAGPETRVFPGDVIQVPERFF